MTARQTREQRLAKLRRGQFAVSVAGMRLDTSGTLFELSEVAAGPDNPPGLPEIIDAMVCAKDVAGLVRMVEELAATGRELHRQLDACRHAEAARLEDGLPQSRAASENAKRASNRAEVLQEFDRLMATGKYTRRQAAMQMDRHRKGNAESILRWDRAARAKHRQR